MLSNASRLSRGVIARSGLEFISGFRDTSFSILIYFQSFIVQSSKTPKLYIGNGRATTSSAVMKQLPGYVLVGALRGRTFIKPKDKAPFIVYPVTKCS